MATTEGESLAVDSFEWYLFVTKYNCFFVCVLLVCLHGFY